MAIQKGIGVVWGISSGNLAAGSGVLRQNSVDFSHERESVEHRGTDGEVVGETLFNESKTVTLEVYPAGTTIANAVTALVARPAPGDAVTITDTTDTVLAGAYRCVSCRARKVTNDKVVLTMELKQNAGVSSYATISS